ncbi:hypothetical protein M3936_11765 [Sutcliffiella horikoshii]|uniref:hypothetical protein n=1 Tax=Sutcliffiella horikoshii TaxID=79883 RepID=UPI00203B5D44|nr:hypothetical protein [Sutcliffiella horikoshii]MCM3618255.1 hypothetical protein [Sutcliffiella horikoshii]
MSSKANWFMIPLFVVMMTVVGLFAFDNIAASLVFGLGVGGIFGWIFSSKKPKEKE